MITAILHLIIGVIMTIGAVFVYYKFYLKTKEDASKKNFLSRIALFYIFMVGYNLSLSLPFFLSADLKILSLGYNLAIVFLFLALVPSWIIWFDILRLPSKNKKVLIALILLIGLATTVVFTLDLRLPTLDDSGFIIWHKNPIAAWLSAIIIASLPGGMAITLFKNWPQKLTSRERFKTISFSLGCSLYALSTIYLIPGNLTTTILAFIFFPTATIIFTLTFFIPESKKETIETSQFQ